MWGFSQAVKTLDFHSRSRGSIPLAPTMPIIRQFFIGYPGHDIKLSVHSGVLSNGKTALSKSVKAQDSDSCYVGFKSHHPSQAMSLEIKSSATPQF